MTENLRERWILTLEVKTRRLTFRDYYGPYCFMRQVQRYFSA